VRLRSFCNLGGTWSGTVRRWSGALEKALNDSHKTLGAMGEFGTLRSVHSNATATRTERLAVA